VSRNVSNEVEQLFAGRSSIHVSSGFMSGTDGSWHIGQD
jgi:hypothetical protein